MKPDNISKFYETDSTIYDSRWLKEGGRVTSESQMKIVSSFTQAWKGYSILEVGCGSGRFSSSVAEVASSVTYLDLTMGMLNVTRDKLKLKHPVFNGINGSAYEIPLASNSRDAVISINVFNHIQEPAKAIREIYRVLRPKGKLLINFTNLYSIYWPFALYIDYKHTSIGRDVYSVWSKPKEVLSLLSSIGFNIIGVVGHVFVPLYLDKPILRKFPIFMDGLLKEAPLKWIAPALFFYCEKR